MIITIAMANCLWTISALYVLSGICTSLAAENPSQYCAEFYLKVRGSDTGTITVVENTTLNLPFAVMDSKTTCNKTRKTFFVGVSRMTKTGLLKDHCLVRFSDQGQCMSFNEHNCPCWTEQGVPEYLGARFGAEFRKTITREDAGQWVWWTDDANIAPKLTVTVQVKQSADVGDAGPSGTSPKRIAPTTTATTSTSSPKTQNKLRPSTTSLVKQNTDNYVRSGQRHSISNEDDVRGDNPNTKHDVTKSDDDRTQSYIIMGVIFSAVNVVAIVIVAVIVYVCRGRRRRQIPQPVLPVHFSSDYDVLLPHDLSMHRGSSDASHNDVMPEVPRHVETASRGEASLCYSTPDRLSTRIYEEIRNN